MTVENISIDVKTNAGNAAYQFRSLSEAIRSVSNAASSVRGANSGASSSMNDVSSSARSAASSSKSAARAIDDVSKSAKKAQSPMGSFAASLKRIAYYRLLRTILKEIAQALKEGLENVYEWSKAGGDMGQIAGALDRISSAGAQLKNQLGAAFGELLAALEPVIVTLLNLLTQLAQALTWVIALLSGKGYYPVAKQIAKDWKEADKAAGGYKNTILGFDEINRLNDEGGGGGSGNNGIGFDYEPLEFGLSNIWPQTFEWLSRFKDEMDDGIGKIKDFVAELATIPELVPVEIAVKVPDFAFDPLLALEPLLVPVEIAILGNPLPIIQALRVALVELAAESPVLVAIKSFVESPVPALQAIVAEVGDWLTELQNEFVTAYQGITETVQAWESAYARASATVQAETISIYNDVNSFVERTKERLSGWALSITETIQSTFSTVAQSVGESLSNAKSNVETFVTSTWSSISSWAVNSAQAVGQAFNNIAQNVYLGLQNAADNIVSFVNSTAQGFANWAVNTATNVFNWAKGVVESIGNALKSAWESVKSFAEAAGAAVGGFFKENANVIVPVAIGAAIVAGAILLAPPTGGASLAAIALAANGGSFTNDGTLFVAGEAGPEIVANMGSRTGVMNVDQMEAAVANGNIGVINAVYVMANMIVQAVDSLDMDVTLDGESMADAMYKYNQSASRRHGAVMVT